MKIHITRIFFLFTLMVMCGVYAFGGNVIKEIEKSEGEGKDGGRTTADVTAVTTPTVTIPPAATVPTAATVAAEVEKETDANVTGHVTDAQTGEHMPYVSVIIKGTTIGTVTDASGHYMLSNLPVGTHVIEVSMLGYKTAEKKVEAVANTLVELNVKLEKDDIMIDEVVVSATRNETSKKEAPIIVNVVSAKLFDNVASSNLAESVCFQPGLRVENNCGNCGTTQLRINGLEGQYSQILLDSRPIFSSLAAVYGLEQLPVSMIERVEVVRGGGSALFGSSAIGGVVNIITKEPLRNSVTLSNTTNILKDGRTDVNTSLNGSFVTDDRRAGVYLFGMLKDRQWYDRNGDGFSEIPEINAETAGFRGYYRTSANTRLTAEYHHIHEYRRGGNLFDHPAHEADIAEQLDHKIDGGGLRFNGFSPDEHHRWDIFASMQSIGRDSYYGAEKAPDAYGRTTDLTVVSGAQYTYAADKFLFLPAELTAGVEYNYNTLDDRYLGMNRRTEQTTHLVGGYVQSEWKSRKVGFLLGARVDKHNLMNSVVVSPRANVRYTPVEAIGLRLSYSSGYRAPQAYNEDLHVEAVGGSLSVIEIAKGLKPEYSHSLSASADWYHSFGRFQTNILAEGFYTMLNDVFTLEKVGQSPEGDIIYWERRNGTGATVKGVNLEGRLSMPDVFDIQLGYTFQSSRYDKPERWSDQLEPQRDMFRTPDIYGYLTSVFYPTKSLSLSLFANHTGSMLVRHTVNNGVVETDSEKRTTPFFDMGIKASYDFKIGRYINLQLNAGVKNILDSYQSDLDFGLYKDAGYVYGPTLPRTVFVGIKIAI